MPYTCMFTVLTDDAFVEEALDHATALAQSSVQGRDAHLEVLCLGVDRSQTGYYYAGASPALLEQTIASAKADAEAIEAKVRDRLDGLPMTWSCDTGVAQLADVARHVAARARFNDLAILPRPYGKGRGVDMEAATEAVLFEAGVPVFTAPPGSDPALTPKRVVVGWNESPEALSAVRAALPILRAADKVHLAVIDPPTHGPNRSDPGGPLSQYLARHDVKVEIDVLSRTLPRVSEVLQRHTVDVGGELLVMGAYGHSRFREAIFGGATRDLLEGATVPLFLAH
jgi:nucleotide-binding universal stress UspA family protein